MWSNNAHAHTWAAFPQLHSVQSGREDKTNQPEASTEGAPTPLPGGKEEGLHPPTLSSDFFLAAPRH